jgi:hypothetical protein
MHSFIANIRQQTIDVFFFLIYSQSKIFFSTFIYVYALFFNGNNPIDADIITYKKKEKIEEIATIKKKRAREKTNVPSEYISIVNRINKNMHMILISQKSKLE